MLRCDVIHGDLSPYNVLLGQQGAVVIDFPQVVGAAHNSQAESFFHRDVENLRRFFAAIDPGLRAAANDAREIWRAYVRRELTSDFVPSGKAVHPVPPVAHAHGEPHRPRSPGGPHEGGSAGRDRSHAERSHHAARPPHEATGAARADPQGRHHSAGPARRDPGGRAPDRRHAAPAPEVIRVARPPLAPKGMGTPAAAPHPPPSAAPPAVAAPRADDGRGRRRRRRRRR
jgi:RIO kinase 1